jgi:inner membrane protein
MKWLNHEIVTGAFVYGFTGGDLASTLAAMAGGLFPDMLEGRPPEDEKKLRKWQALHRGVSHWFLPYAMVAAIVIVPSVFHLSKGTPRYVLSLLGYCALGCLFHIAEDVLCGRVPSLDPCTRIGVRFFTVGSPREYLFSFSLAALLFLGMLLP